ncbi:Thiol-disulfide isomerase and thioredoxin [Mannheimia sp. USDA-ARS-USMARC-1261]|uniref:thioredoxin family protein n=1 Tax=Mannheimia sp. USDA-ARS-USMARC-1261 TaxID=1432056 RepID=UPI0003E32ED4|nr:thioredoxin family protein [Mannheimia sp. USDA-ARS-USMARC-1261]AHG74157.1 Thiol-disulfide isomerase and thioredoxin [Mannheimia sp. USDA-ARS-USMARC-1261]
MAHFYEYLEFNSDEDRENQLEVYIEVKLEPETEEKLKSIGVQGDWLVMAEPHCPDCVEVVAYFQRMAKLNPNIKVEYIFCKEAQEAKQFKHDEQLQAVISEQKIPTIFDVSSGKAEVVLSEFPQFLKDKIEEQPEQSDQLIADFRMGKLGKEVEKELLAVLTKVK